MCVFIQNIFSSLRLICSRNGHRHSALYKDIFSTLVMARSLSIFTYMNFQTKNVIYMFYLAVNHVCLNTKSALVSDIAVHLLLLIIDRFARECHYYLWVYVWKAFLSIYSRNLQFSWIIYSWMQKYKKYYLL